MQTITSRFARVASLALLLAALITGVASAVPGNQVPFKGVAAGSIVGVAPTPAGVLFTIEASGQATHMGHFDRVEHLLLDPVTQTFTGSITFVAANQDQLVVSLAGGFVAPGKAVGTYTVIAGGTGHYLGASGSAAFEALLDPDGIHVTVKFNGTLSAVSG